MQLIADSLVRCCSEAIACALNLARESSPPEDFARVEQMYRDEPLNISLSVTVDPGRLFQISLDMIDADGAPAAHLIALKARLTETDHLWIQ